ncbi:uncharacterized protein MAM_07348 [Metarhizium album ARSEF 1941]|uniref:Uncharacterized protein n=1 Tax=Metarhizium album (strain ARSEF 1941) TaxID=1081103 RepID=A0A0B2WMR0_METAS|nr:uncharacterized protein MAM_07348 [Metarhizium album ARSEF 1941]KHN94752.1 hypothetical protein MAM_07348 [Metarhizium album ARSEF 1941]
MYCAACLAAEDCGTIDKRLERLRSLLYCTECSVLHTRALFPEDNAAYGLASNEQICIGWLERLTVCDHRLATSLSWRDMIDFSEVARNKTCQITCPHRSHQPEPKSGRSRKSGSEFPRFFAQELPNDFTTRIGYAWDLPLLDLEHRSDHSLPAIQERLSNLVVDALHNHNHRLCPHISADKEIRNFVQSGICNCFAKHDTRHVGPKAPWPKACECGRQVTLECRICGAVYMWYLARGQVFLSLRYSWNIQKPSSFGWLGLLGFQMKFSSRDNQHVLWCDTPNCRTNKRRRWEALVKENVAGEYFEDRYLGPVAHDEQDDDGPDDGTPDDDGSVDSFQNEEQDEDFTGLNYGFDFEEMMTASENGSFQNW